MYEFEGEIYKTFPTRMVGAKQRPMRFLWIKETPESKYPNIVQFVLKGEKCKVADGLTAGSSVKVGFVVEGRVWDKKDGSDPKCFCDNVCLRLDRTAEAPVTDLPMKGEEEGDPDDMPF